MDSKPVVKVVLYKHKTLSDGRHPIMIRISQAGRKKYYSLGHSLFPHQWNYKSNIPNKEGSKLYPELSLLIQEELLKAENYIINFKRENGDSQVSLQNLYDYLTNAEAKKGLKEEVKNEPVKLVSYTEKIIESQKNAGKIKTSRIYQDLQRVLNHFLKECYKVNDMNLESFDLSALETFHSFLQSDYFKNKKGKSGLGLSSISLYLRTLRAVIRRAISEELLPESCYPFKKFKMSKYSNIQTRKRFITEEEINKIKTFETNDKNLSFARDMYLFSYYCRGMNFKDLCYLTKDNVVKGRIEYERIKTKKRTMGDIDNTAEMMNNTISIPITTEIKSILDKYYSEDSPFLLPILNKTHLMITPANREYMMTRITDRIEKINKYVNRDIKTIAIQEGIIEKGESFSFYSARHTYATVMQRRGVSVSVIRQTMGHKTEMQTTTYLGGLSWEEVDKAVGIL